VLLTSLNAGQDDALESTTEKSELQKIRELRERIHRISENVDSIEVIADANSKKGSIRQELEPK
jgi:hypothetical protein